MEFSPSLHTDCYAAYGCLRALRKDTNSEDRSTNSVQYANFFFVPCESVSIGICLILARFLFGVRTSLPPQRGQHGARYTEQGLKCLHSRACTTTMAACTIPKYYSCIYTNEEKPNS
eukprot:792706-Pleurochrysis_carterae.AAC.1